MDFNSIKQFGNQLGQNINEMKDKVKNHIDNNNIGVTNGGNRNDFNASELQTPI